MKILFVFTGGTIGSLMQGSVIATDSNAPYLLLEKYREAYGAAFSYETVAPYTALSENNTGETLHTLLACVAKQLHKGFDGIVVTHGTDTLQYSAAALSYALADTPIPICLVSAAQPIEHPQSNAMVNLRGALRFIAEVGTRGVYVSYQNKGEPLRIHRGTRLLESVAFSDRVCSIYDSFVGEFYEGKCFAPNPAYQEVRDALPPFGVPPLSALAREILCINAYVGMQYPAIPPEVRYILHSSYHSGTINTADADAKCFFEQARARRIPVFLTGAAHGAQYESTTAFKQLAIQPLYSIAPIAAYVKLWMLHAKSPDTSLCAEILQRSLAGDVAVIP